MQASNDEIIWWVCDICQLRMKEERRETHKTSVFSRCAKDWTKKREQDEQDRLLAIASSSSTTSSSSGSGRASAASNAEEQQKAVKAKVDHTVTGQSSGHPLPLDQPSTKAKRQRKKTGEELVSCTYDAEKGYIFEAVLSKQDFKRLYHNRTYNRSLASSGTKSHLSTSGFWWFAKSKFDHLTSMNRPKDKDLWGHPTDSHLLYVNTWYGDDATQDEGAGAATGEKDDGDEEQSGGPPAKRRAKRSPVEPTAEAAAAAAFTPVAAPAVVQDSVLVLTLQEALKSERKDKERAWAQNDFLKDELARSREDLKEQREENKALRGKAQELAAQLRAAQTSSGGAVTPSATAAAAAAAAAAAMDIVLGGDGLLL